ncbi:hypothetical protein EV363DRAFT_1139096, partial [Boletus edulis]
EAMFAVEAMHPMLVKDSGYKVCTIVADPSGASKSGAVTVHLISNSTTSFSTVTLDRLREFLQAMFCLPNPTFKVAAEEKELDDECEASLDHDEEAEEEFAQEILALEKDIDATAEDDPNVQVLERVEDNLEFLEPSSPGEDVDDGGGGGGWGSGGIDSEGGEGGMSVPLSRGKKRGVFADSDSSVIHSESPNAKPRTTDDPAPSKRQRMAYVLIPQRQRRVVPTIPSSSPTSLTPPSPALPPDEAEAIMQNFMLTAEELKSCESPKNYYAQAEAAFKYTFGIDLSKVSGRTRKWSGEYGISASDILRKLAVAQDVHAVPATNQLQYDSDLSEIGCAYLPDYEVIVCQNLHEGDICGQAIPLGTLMAHCHSDGKRAHRIPFCKRVNDKIILAQRQFIARLLIRYPNIVATQAELKEVRMLPNQFGPISNLPTPCDGFACNHCDFATKDSKTTTKVLARHWTVHVKEGDSPLPKFKQGTNDILRCDKFQRCQLQTLSHSSQVIITWLKVPPGRIVGRSSIQPPTTHTVGALIAASLVPKSSTPTTINRSLLLPFFRDIRASDFIQRILPSTAVELVSLPTKQEPTLFRLKIHHVEAFKRSCQGIQDAPIIVQEALVKPKEGERRMTERFRCPTKATTVHSYALEEVMLLCFVLRCIKRNLICLDAETPWDGDKFYLPLTSRQLAGFQQLLVSLQDPQSSNCDLSNAVKVALKSIYMPDNRFDILAHPFLSAIIAYIGIRSIHPEGGFWNPKRLTSFYAKTQFGIRLFLLSEACDAYAEHKKRSGNNDDKCRDYTRWLEEFIASWAMEENRVSPLSLLRRWIRALSRIARITPTATCILWDAGNSALSIRGHVLFIEAYKSQVRNTLKVLVDSVDRDVLLGVQLPEEAYLLPKMDDDDINTRGYGLFTATREALGEALTTGNHPSCAFLMSLLQSGTLCQIHDGVIRWDSKQLAVWLMNIADAWSTVLVLLHLLSLPARGTEEIIWQHANSVSSPRHLFLSPHLRTLVTQSNYSKTTALTGLYKYIIRPIPFILAKVIGILLQIVRPIEMMAVLSHAPGQDEEQIRENYSTYMFVIAGKLWKKNGLSMALKAWYMKWLKVPFGLNLHRHFAQALQRKFHSYRNQDSESSLEEVANKGFGHSREVADVNYAREPGDLAIATSDRQRFEEVGTAWIEWYGIDISP